MWHESEAKSGTVVVSTHLKNVCQMGNLPARVGSNKKLIETTTALVAHASERPP